MVKKSKWDEIKIDQCMFDSWYYDSKETINFDHFINFLDFKWDEADKKVETKTKWWVMVLHGGKDETQIVGFLIELLVNRVPVKWKQGMKCQKIHMTKYYNWKSLQEIEHLTIK